jgi:integral membrane protein
MIPLYQSMLNNLKQQFKQAMTNRIRILRIIGILEGISYLVLLGIAMPLKYIYAIPEAVKFTGWAHGVLFMAFIPAVFMARKMMNWNFIWTALALTASLIPLGTFILDKYLVKREKELLRTVTE